MGYWERGEYNREQWYYTVSNLWDIAESYFHIYQGIDFYRRGIFKYTVTNPWLIAEYKADFDGAVKSLSPRKQRFIRLIIGEEITNGELEVRGFYDAEKFKLAIFKEMANFLNGIDNGR